MARHKDLNWKLAEGTPKPGGGFTTTYEVIQCALLMDIRDELQGIRAILLCPSTQRIPITLQRIARNTTRPKRKKKP